METPLPPHIALFAAGLIATVAALVWIVSRRETIGSTAIAAALAAGFAAFTTVTIAAEGTTQVVINHASNLWGVQVWWDLLIAASIAIFLIQARARAVGMNVALWAPVILATGSIGLLAMCARLFWLERAQAAAKAA